MISRHTRPILPAKRHTRHRALPVLRALVGGAVFLSTWGAGGEARGQPAAQRAHDLAEVGALASSLGKYDFAIHALSEAFALGHRPDVLFALAEAHRQRYALASKPADRARAVAGYRRYLAAAPAGVRRAAAERALASLEAGTEGGAADAAAEEPTVARVGVTSPTLNASARIDGGSARALPLFTEIAPGPHTVAVSAPEHNSVVRKIVISAGAFQAVSLSLEPTPGRLLVEAPSGAQVRVDGKLVGSAPLPRPIDVDPGRHHVAVTLTGFHARAQEVDARRGRTTRVRVALEATRQRNVAWALLGTGAAALATGITLGVLSVVEQRIARDVDQRGDDGEPSAEDRQERADALSARDDFRVGSGLAAGAGLGLFLVGGTLLTLDNPAIPEPRRRGDRGAPDLARHARSRVDVSARPTLAPGFSGGAVAVRF